MGSKFRGNCLRSLTMIGVLVAIITISGLLAACGVNPKQGELNQNQEEIMVGFNELIESKASLTQIIEYLDMNMSKAVAENASTMSSEFEKQQKEYLPKLEAKFYEDNDIQVKLSNAFMNDFDINKIYQIEAQEVQMLLKETKDSGYKVETAEGMFFPIINYEFYKKYSAFVTMDIARYIDIMAIESENMPAKDGALVIGWDEIVKRALNQEEFINTHNNSLKIDEIKSLYRNYVMYALFGLNNTPLFSYDTKIMSNNAKNAYLDAVETNTTDGFIMILRGYLNLLEENDYKLTDEVEDYRKGILENL